MTKEKRYVEIEIEVECDEEGMTDDAWAVVNCLDGLYDVVPEVKRIGMPYRISQRER